MRHPVDSAIPAQQMVSPIDQIARHEIGQDPVANPFILDGDEDILVLLIADGEVFDREFLDRVIAVDDPHTGKEDVLIGGGKRETELGEHARRRGTANLDQFAASLEVKVV